MNVLALLGFGGGEPSSVRDRLRTALANRDRAQGEFDEARQAVARVEEVIESARAANRSAVKASAAAADAARAWAAAGADPAAASEFERLRAVAADAERGAQRAEFLADGARAGLGKVRDAQSICEARLSNANAEVREANAMMVYVEENIAVKLVEREQLARQIEKVDIELLGFFRTISSARPGWRDSIEFESREAAKLIEAGLERGRIRDPGERVCVNGSYRAGTGPCAELSERTALWRARLRENLNVQF